MTNKQRILLCRISIVIGLCGVGVSALQRDAETFFVNGMIVGLNYFILDFLRKQS